jgi:hypothetical protein
MSLLAVKRAIDHVAGVGQRGCKLAIEIGIVFDDEKAQSGLLIPPVKMNRHRVNGK